MTTLVNMLLNKSDIIYYLHANAIDNVSIANHEDTLEHLFPGT